jgi:hypothetical protein
MNDVSCLFDITMHSIQTMYYIIWGYFTVVRERMSVLVVWMSSFA